MVTTKFFLTVVRSSGQIKHVNKLKYFCQNLTICSDNATRTDCKIYCYLMLLKGASFWKSGSWISNINKRLCYRSKFKEYLIIASTTYRVDYLVLCNILENDCIHGNDWVTRENGNYTDIFLPVRWRGMRWRHDASRQQKNNIFSITPVDSIGLSFGG